MQSSAQSAERSVGVVVQARMGSTRLPGKVLLAVRGITLLERLLRRLSLVTRADHIVVATTVSRQDGPIVSVSQDAGALVYRGSEHDVLARYRDAAAEFSLGTIIRITADCPLMDPAVVDKVICAFEDAKEQTDYASNTLHRTYPRGLDVEVISRDALESAAREATDPAHREHVTPFLYRQPDRFRLLSVTNQVDYSGHRWTVDTQEDFALIEAVIDALEPEDFEFGMDDVLAFLDARPDLRLINAHVEQKLA